MKNSSYNRAKKTKNYYPQKTNKQHYPKKTQPKKHSNRQDPTNIFSGNLVDNMKFGQSGDDLSGFVKREVVVVAKDGSKKIARETQFFNSGKKISRVKVHDDETEF